LGIDNIDVQKNVLTIGAHRNVIDLYSHVISQSNCPSAVIRITFDELNETIERMFGDDGNQMSIISSGLINSGKFLMGVGYTGPFMICQKISRKISQKR